VLNEVTGLRVDGTSTERVTDGLRRLLQDATWADSLGQAGLNRVEQQFAWERVASATQERILEGRE
jgi:glycosyltransferase involved in cell wall biosynthesis